MISEGVLFNDAGEVIHRFDFTDILAMGCAQRDLLQRHTCVIATPTRSPTEIGSGTIIEIGEYAVVLTAAHVLEGKTVEEIGLLGWYQDFTHPIPLGGCIRSDEIDVGCVYVEKKALEGSRLTGLPLDHIQTCVAHVSFENDIIVVCGAPSEQASPPDQLSKTMNVGFEAIATKTIPLEDWPSASATICSVNPKHDIFLYYSGTHAADDSLSPSKPIDPRGMSGGGIWRVPLKSDGVWSPLDARLIGVQSKKESTKWKWLRGVQIQHAIGAVWHSLPEARPAICEAGFTVNDGVLQHSGS